MKIMHLKTLLLTLTICAITLQALTEPAYAQISEFKITASDGAADDLFGLSVSISGDYAVVGAVLDDDNGDQSGSAYMFKRTGTNWTQEAKLLPSDGAADDLFGVSVSISGDYTVVGAWLDDDNGDQSGSAYIFKRIGTSWVQEAKLLASDGATNDQFGWSVSISGDYAILGARGDDDNGNNSGSAYVFKRTGTSWVHEAKLLPFSGAAFDDFGVSVSILDDYVIVGAMEDNLNRDRSGSAYVFKRTGTSWQQEAKLLASDGADRDLFGVSVSISGDYAVVGAHYNDINGDRSGSAYVFKRAGTSWAQEAILLPSDGEGGDLFGLSVSISGDFAVVGAWGDDTRSGSAYLYNGFTPSVGVESERAGLPAEFTLSQNYPNPFNPVTKIEYSLPVKSEVRLIIYNLLGKEVARLVDGNMTAGNHQVTWDASNVSSGIYFYQLQAGDFVRTRKMVLLK